VVFPLFLTLFPSHNTKWACPGTSSKAKNGIRQLSFFRNVMRNPGLDEDFGDQVMNLVFAVHLPRFSDLPAPTELSLAFLHAEGGEPYIDTDHVHHTSLGVIAAEDSFQSDNLFEQLRASTKDEKEAAVTKDKAGLDYFTRRQ